MGWAEGVMQNLLMMYTLTGFCFAYLVLLITIICFVVTLRMRHILFSASEGPDSVAEELNLVRNMDIAVKEERYNDAGKH